MLFRKIGCLVGPKNWVKRKIISADCKICPLILEKHFRFYFTFKSLPELRRAKRGAHKRAKGERERERMTHRRAPRWSRSRLCADRSPPSNLVTSLSLPSSLNLTGFDIFFFSGFCLCFCIGEWMILYICLTIEKMRPNLMIFFWILFVFLYWKMNDIYSFDNRENMSNK